MTENDPLAVADKAYRAGPTYKTALELSEALRKAGHAAEATDFTKRWIGKVDDSHYLARYAVNMHCLGMYEESEVLFRELLGAPLSDWDLHRVRSELAMVLEAQGKLHEAYELHRSLREKAGSAMLLHQLYEGHDAAFTEKALNKVLDLYEPVSGKKILVLLEGGAGDLLMYSRYLGKLREEGALAVYLEAPYSMLGILRQEPWLNVIHDRSAVVDECDSVTWIFSLFVRYQSSPYYPNMRESWIVPPTNQDVSESVRKSLECGRDGIKKIAIIWRSPTTIRHEPYRSVELRTLTPLLGSPACQFYSLQMGSLTVEEQTLIDQYGIVELGSGIRTFSDTAHVLYKMDLLICVDTGPGHLAGSLDRPVWLLLSRVCDHRWHNCKRFTAWYSSMRLYRQEVLGDWTTPLATMSADLKR